MILSPCVKCADRCIGCHGQEANGLYKCARYAAFVHQRAADAEARRRIEQAERDVEITKRNRGKA